MGPGPLGVGHPVCPFSSPPSRNTLYCPRFAVHHHLSRFTPHFHMFEWEVEREPPKLLRRCPPPAFCVLTFCFSLPRPPQRGLAVPAPERAEAAQSPRCLEAKGDSPTLFPKSLTFAVSLGWFLLKGGNRSATSKHLHFIWHFFPSFSTLPQKQFIRPVLSLD